MSLQVKLALKGDLAKFAADVKKRLLTAERDARDEMGTRLKLALRADVRNAGLGEGVANAWQYKGYPGGNRLAYRPAGIVYSNAPKIIAAFSANTTIVAKHRGWWLAIPTENTPRVGNKRATVEQVETMFNQSVTIFHGRGGQLLAFVDVVKAKSGRGFRQPTKRRLKDGRKNELTLMFVLVRQVHLRKRLDFNSIAASAQADWQRIMGERVAAELQGA